MSEIFCVKIISKKAFVINCHQLIHNSQSTAGSLIIEMVVDSAQVFVTSYIEKTPTCYISAQTLLAVY